LMVDIAKYVISKALNY